MSNKLRINSSLYVTDGLNQAPRHTRCSNMSSIAGCRARPYFLRRFKNETLATGLYVDRTDDRGCDHRHPGGHRAAGVPGLCDPFEDVGRCCGYGGVQDVDQRIRFDEERVADRRRQCWLLDSCHYVCQLVVGCG